MVLESQNPWCWREAMVTEISPESSHLELQAGNKKQIRNGAKLWKRQFSEFRTSLVYKVNSRTISSPQGNLFMEIQTKDRQTVWYKHTENDKKELKMKHGEYTGQNELKGNMIMHDISTKYLNVVLSLSWKFYTISYSLNLGVLPERDLLSYRMTVPMICR